MLVVDASVLAPVVVDVGEDGRRLRRRLRSEAIAGPDLVRIEVLSVVRRHVAAGRLGEEQARRAVDDLARLPIAIHPTGRLVRRAWELRENVTPYDACYVALAEVLGCPLLTADARLARAPGLRCAVELFGSSDAAG